MTDAPPATAEASPAAALDAAAILFHDAPLPVYLRAADGTFLDANKALALLFGYESPASFLRDMATLPDQFYLNPEARQGVLRDLDASGAVTGRQYQAIGRDGFVLWVEESARIIVAGPGEHYYFGYLRDITTEKSTRWALHEAEAASEEEGQREEQQQAEEDLEAIRPHPDEGQDPIKVDGIEGKQQG